MTFSALLAGEFRPYVELSQQQLLALEQHYELLLRWNRRLNLTRIVDLENAVRFHYCESLFLAKLLPDDTLTVADLGSGAGFPGIPVAVLRPQARVVLFESDGRKTVFLREATRALHNIEVVGTRFESCQRRFEWVVSRAVAADSVLASGLSSNFALLASQEGTPAGSRTIPVPWGRSRAVVIVSRGTSDEEVIESRSGWTASRSGRG